MLPQRFSTRKRASAGVTPERSLPRVLRSQMILQRRQKEKRPFTNHTLVALHILVSFHVRPQMVGHIEFGIAQRTMERLLSLMESHVIRFVAPRKILPADCAMEGFAVLVLTQVRIQIAHQFEFETADLAGEAARQSFAVFLHVLFEIVFLYETTVANVAFVLALGFQNTVFDYFTGSCVQRIRLG